MPHQFAFSGFVIKRLLGDRGRAGVREGMEGLMMMRYASIFRPN